MMGSSCHKLDFSEYAPKHAPEAETRGHLRGKRSQMSWVLIFTSIQWCGLPSHCTDRETEVQEGPVTSGGSADGTTEPQVEIPWH